MLKRLLPAAAVALTVAALAGCTSAPIPTRSTPPALDLRETTRLVDDEWTAPVTLAGPPRVVDGTVTAYVVDDGELAIAGWDATTGEELWREWADSGGVSETTTPVPAMVSAGGLPYVAYLGHRKEAPFDELVVVRADTGDRVEMPDAALVPGGLPWVCGASFCIQRAVSHDDGRDTSVPWPTLRVDPRHPAPSTSATEALPAGSRPAGTSLVAIPGSTPSADAIAAHRGARVLWRARLATIFGRGYTLNGGYSWERSKRMLVGTGLRARSTDRGSTARLHDQVVVGLDPKSGTPRWRRPGLGRCSDAGGLRTVGDTIVACSWESGTIALAKGIDAPATIRSPRFRVVGIDRRTGETRWRTRKWTDGSVFMDARPNERSTRYAAPNALVLDTARTHEVVNLGTGATSRIPRGAVLACTTAPGSVETSWTSDGEPMRIRSSGGYSACGPDRTPRDRWSEAAVRAVDLHLDGRYWLIPEPGRLRAVNLPAPPH